MRVFFSHTRKSCSHKAGQDLTKWWCDIWILMMWMCTIAGIDKISSSKAGCSNLLNLQHGWTLQRFAVSSEWLGENNVPSSTFKVRRALVPDWTENKIHAAELESMQICLLSKRRDCLCGCSWLWYPWTHPSCHPIAGLQSVSEWADISCVKVTHLGKTTSVTVRWCA